jgi:hypothetical protein
MDPVSLSAFGNEMTKIAGFKEFFQRILDFFSSPDDRAGRKADRFLSPEVGKEKWDYIPRYAGERGFVSRVLLNPTVDSKMKEHVKAMHRLSRAKTVAKVPSSKGFGKTYEIRELPGGRLGCQCNDWRFVGSVTPGYECRHIREFKAGKSRAA